MKEFFKKALKFFAALFTDAEWDGDAVKVFGIGLIICGVIGFFNNVSDFQWIIGFGASLIASGKFSSQG